jgi:hypothetical protein
MRIRNECELRNNIKKQIERLESSQRREMRCKKKRRKKKGTKLRIFRLRIHDETPAPFTVNGKDM